MVHPERSSAISVDKNAPRAFYEHGVERRGQPLRQLLHLAAALKAKPPGLLLAYGVLEAPQDLSQRHLGSPLLAARGLHVHPHTSHPRLCPQPRSSTPHPGQGLLAQQPFISSALPQLPPSLPGAIVNAKFAPHFFFLKGRRFDRNKVQCIAKGLPKKRHKLARSVFNSTLFLQP